MRGSMLASISLVALGATTNIVLTGACYNIRVGTFFHSITLVGPNGTSQTVEALVDTDASFTSVPASVLQQLGVRPFRRARLRLANGAIAESDLGRVTARIDGLEDETICIFGAEGAAPVIGAHTLQAMLLAVDTVDHRLVPTEGFLMTMTREARFRLAQTIGASAVRGQSYSRYFG